MVPRVDERVATLTVLTENFLRPSSLQSEVHYSSKHDEFKSPTGARRTYTPCVGVSVCQMTPCPCGAPDVTANLRGTTWVRGK